MLQSPFVYCFKKRKRSNNIWNMPSYQEKDGVGIFFIYDHVMLQKEEDDLKDAILYFYPPFVSDDDQCALCGQLMGMSEFLYSTISKSSPSVFKLQKAKYGIKRTGNYTFGLEGNLQDTDAQLMKQLNYLYDAFVMYCGSLTNIRQQYSNDHQSFLKELRAIWDILYPCGCWHDSYLTQAFQILPSVEINQGSGELFLQASNILQSSQRRPGVLVGLIMYKNRVLCTQTTPELGRKLVLVTPQLPCLHYGTDFELPVGVRLITIFLTSEEFESIKPKQTSSHRHCKPSKFVYANSKSDDQPGQTGNSYSKRAPSRGDNSKRKEMEIIPEKSESCSKEGEDKLPLNNISADNGNGKRSCLGSKNGHLKLWKPAEHQTQLTQVFESQEVGKTSDSEQAEDVSISDLEVDLNGQVRKASKSSIFNQSISLKKSLTSSEDDTRNGNDPVVQIIAEIHRGNGSSDYEEKENVEPNVSDNIENVGSVVNKAKLDLDNISERKEEIDDLDKDSVSENNNSSKNLTGDSENEMKEKSSVSDTDSPSCLTISDSNTDVKKEIIDFVSSDTQGVSESESAEASSKHVKTDKKIFPEEAKVPPSSISSSFRSSLHSSVFSSLPDSLTSENLENSMWSSEDDGLHEVSLYIQTHSEISLLLLMTNGSIDSENVIHSLWKGALPMLADLDFYVKESVSNCIEESYMDNYAYLKYDSFFHTLKGNVLQPLTGGDEEFQKLAGSIHRDFCDNKDLTDVVLRSHVSCCYGHHTYNDETYYTSTPSANIAAVLEHFDDPSTSLDLIARTELPKKQNIALL